MCYVYVLKSLKDGRYYVGSTRSLKERLRRHSQGGCLATEYRRPLDLVYWEKYPTNSEAVNAELYIKRQKSKKFIKELILRARSSGGRAADF